MSDIYLFSKGYVKIIICLQRIFANKCLFSKGYVQTIICFPKDMLKRIIKEHQETLNEDNLR